MQTHRPLLDRLQLLTSTLTSQLTDSNERDRIRRHRRGELSIGLRRECKRIRDRIRGGVGG